MRSRYADHNIRTNALILVARLGAIVPRTVTTVPPRDGTGVLERIAQASGSFVSDDTGATAIEYAVIASFIFLGLVPLIQMMGGSVGVMYDKILGYFETMGA